MRKISVITVFDGYSLLAYGVFCSEITVQELSRVRKSVVQGNVEMQKIGVLRQIKAPPPKRQHMSQVKVKKKIVKIVRH